MKLLISLNKLYIAIHKMAILRLLFPHETNPRIQDLKINDLLNIKIEDGEGKFMTY